MSVLGTENRDGNPADGDEESRRLNVNVDETIAGNSNHQRRSAVAGHANMARRTTRLFRPARASGTALDSKQHDPALTGADNAPTKPVTPSSPRPQQGLRQAIAFGLVAVALLGALTAWLGMRVLAADGVQDQRPRFLAAGRQSAIMLTTVKHDDVESDVKRIIDSSTGAFLADFQNRSRAFVDTVTRTKSNTAGTVAEAGLESVHGDQADVLVAVSVKISLAELDSPARLWRMRLTVQRVGNDIKLSNVQFVE